MTSSIGIDATTTTRPAVRVGDTWEALAPQGIGTHLSTRNAFDRSNPRAVLLHHGTRCLARPTTASPGIHLAAEHSDTATRGLTKSLSAAMTTASKRKHAPRRCGILRSESSSMLGERTDPYYNPPGYARRDDTSRPNRISTTATDKDPEG